MSKPLLQALLLADHVYQDKDTGKKVIAGTFNSLSISKTKAPPKDSDQAAARRGPPDPGATGAAGPAVGRPQQNAPQHDVPQHDVPQQNTPQQNIPQQNVPQQNRPLSAAEITRPGNPTAFISLTDFRGPTDLELRYVDLTDQGVLLMLKFRVFSDDPLKTVEAILPVPPLPTPHPGVYALELLFNEELLGSLRVTAVEVPAPSGP
jgi:hypothetical protein